MFAIIRKNGKQYRVSKGETIKFDKINSEPGGVFETEETCFETDIVIKKYSFLPFE